MSRRTEKAASEVEWIPWHELPQEGGLFESTELLALHRLGGTLSTLEQQILETSSALAQLDAERAAARESGYKEGFELGLAQWTDAHQQLREQADAWLETAQQRAERCLKELLTTWLDAELQAEPAPVVRHLAAILKKQLPARPRVHIRYAANADTAARGLHAQLAESAWTADLECDEELNAGLIVDHPHGRILFDTRQLVQQVMREEAASSSTGGVA